MINITKSFKFFEPFREISFENFSKWGKALFTDLFLPVIDGDVREDIYTLLFFTNPTEYLEKEDPIDYITYRYGEYGVERISDPTGSIYLSSIRTSEVMKLENGFLLRWFKGIESKPVPDNEPNSFLDSSSSLDRYLLIYSGNLFSLFPFEDVIAERNIISIIPGVAYVSNILTSLDVFTSESSRFFSIYPTDFPMNVAGKMKIYNKNEYDHYTDYSSSYVYVFRDESCLDSSEYLICLHPLFMNGVLFKRLHYLEKFPYYDGSLKDTYVEKNDFLAGIEPPHYIIKGMSNKFVISLIHVPIYEKINPLIYGSIAVLGKVSLTFSGENNRNVNFVPDSLSYSCELNINLRGNLVKLKWERKNYEFPIRRESTEIVIQPKDFTYFFSFFYPKYYGLLDELYEPSTYVLSVDGGDVDKSFYYEV